jgi:hypothetical protein
MWQSILDLITSNKFKVTFFSILALVCTALTGTMTWAEVIDKAWPIVVAYLGAQGLADLGKNKIIAEQREIRRRELANKG